MTNKTISEYKEVIKACKEVFKKRTRDYGTARRILGLSSITNQIMIEARQIRSIQEKGFQNIDDDIPKEFLRIVNYCIMIIMQLKLTSGVPLVIKF
ncbi:MAG: DUF1599 domain-containing protein [Cyclobacteriaceae bacterium]|nr:DUF1599 domain-containing protein [Cyclobacteriaceae bacterium]